MRTMRRNKRPMYLCQQYIDENGLQKYKKPIKLYENYNSVQSDNDLIVMGMDYPDRLRIKADNRICVDGEWFNRDELYHVGDRLYVYIEPPKIHDVLCKTADYEVEIEPHVGTTINQISLTLKKLSGKKK